MAGVHQVASGSHQLSAAADQMSTATGSIARSAQAQEAGRSAKTLNGYRSAFTAFLGWMEKRGRIVANPWQWQAAESQSAISRE